MQQSIDPESYNEIFQLDNMHLLDKRTRARPRASAHPETISLINQSNTALIICPLSNLFLFPRPFPLFVSFHQADRTRQPDSPIHRGRRPTRRNRYIHSLLVSMRTDLQDVTSNPQRSFVLNMVRTNNRIRRG